MSEFKQIKTLAEAKALASKIMPTSLNKTIFFIGNSKCTILNLDNLFRICVENEEEVICYNFVKIKE